jgi:hypothetical protein
VKRFSNILCFFAMYLCVAFVAGLQAQQAEKPKIDTRIWSQSYWRQMAERGLVPFNQEVPYKPAVYKGSVIEIGRVAFDSTDVPVTALTNTTQSENSIFVHPTNNNIVLNSNNSTDYPFTTLYGTSGFVSTDGGVTWGGQVTGTGGSNWGDPAAAIDGNGRFYVGYITASDFGQGVAYSTNQGTSWTAVKVANGNYPSIALDKNHLWVDNRASSPYQGYLYAAWTNFGGANDAQIEFSRSTNAGLNWSTPISVSDAVSAGSHNQGVIIQTGPNGEVYVAWAIYDVFPADEVAIGLAKSTNGGATFAAATRIIGSIRGIRNTSIGKNMRKSSFPSMAVDISGGANDGAIYVVWANIGVPGVNTGNDVDVYMIKSTNGGSNWTTPSKVNQDASGLGKKHYFPWITCDPVTGNLAVIFYDDRNTASTDCEVFVATSSNGGSTWTDFKVSDVSFTPSPVTGLSSGYFGDYLGIAARGGKVYPCWTDNRIAAGSAMTYVSPFTIGPNAPTSLGASPISSNQIDLTWTDNATDEDGFKIERKTGAGGTYAQIDTAGVNAISYSDTTVSVRTAYYYRVRAYNVTGDSVYSNESNTSVVPVAPTGLAASPISATQIDLSWADNSGSEDGFKIERKTGVGGTYSQIATTGANATFYSDTTLSAETTYYYRVMAYNAAGDSAYSNEANASTLSAPARSGGRGRPCGATGFEFVLLLLFLQISRRLRLRSRP